MEYNLQCNIYQRAPPPPIALASHVGHRGLEVTVHRPVLGSLGQLVDFFLWTKERHLVVAEGDGEPSIVAVDDLNAVVSRAAGQREDYTKTFYTHCPGKLVYRKYICVFWCYI